jgi:hypothetical protein
MLVNRWAEPDQTVQFLLVIKTKELEWGGKVSVDQIIQYTKSLETRIDQLEDLLNQIGKNINREKLYPEKTQNVNWPSMHRALCVDTLDPWKRNRVRFYHPIFHDPNSPLLGLPFAWPVSAQGGFDDSGCNWVPPAGSTLVMLFENGNRSTPFYIGTTWQGDRGAGGANLGFPCPEYSNIYNGHRDGYLVGPNDESQVFPQWNTESYNNFDTTSIEDFVNDTGEQQRMTYPNIYGWKTPEKHMIKMVDGNAKCDRRWKRIEIQSGCGNYMIFKDDHLHYGGQWAHPSCNATPGGADVSQCSNGSGDIFTDPQGMPIEQGEMCSGQSSSGSIIGGHPSTPTNPPDAGGASYENEGTSCPARTAGTMFVNSQTGSNQYFKHQNECRPVSGPGTPQNNRIDLPQSGIQFLSISGHTMVMDDSVQEPSGIPNWERSTEPFDFGCNNLYLGVFYIKSATGHSFVMSDVEADTGLRGNQNYVQLKSALGNTIELNDHTVGEGNCEECPPNYAGCMRGIHLQSTSKHQINMNDNMNMQCGPCRAEGGTPTAAATKAFIQIISGYGLEMRFNDDNSQQTTQNQWIQITNPQAAQNNADSAANTTRGPHFLRFQGQPEGTPGIVFLRAGGYCIRSTYDMDIVMVGAKGTNPANKFTYVSQMQINDTETVDYRYAGQLHVMFAEEQILLMAGRDCSPAPGSMSDCNGPCLYPVVVGRCPVTCPVTGIIHWTQYSLSERVFASAKNIVCPPSPDAGTVIPPTGQPAPCSSGNTTQTINTGAGTVTTTTPPPQQMIETQPITSAPPSGTPVTGNPGGGPFSG